MIVHIGPDVDEYNFDVLKNHFSQFVFTNSIRLSSNAPMILATIASVQQLIMNKYIGKLVANNEIQSNHKIQRGKNCQDIMCAPQHCQEANGVKY